MKNQLAYCDNMKYLDSINMLLLILLLHSTSATSGCSFDDKISPEIKAIGRPIGSIKVIWDSVNSSGKLLLYQVYYNRTSLWNHCEYPTTDAFYTAKHCGQYSTREGIRHECELTKDYKMLKLDMINDSLCIMISINSPWLNKTCYRFLQYNSYVNGVDICPAPENLQVSSHKAGKLAVHWTVSPKFVGKKALKAMSFIIHYEPVGNSTIRTAKERKILRSQAYNFSHKKNTYIIDGLLPCCPYMVTICCAFSTIDPVCHPAYISDPFYATTAEPEPAMAPLVERSFLQHKSLMVKWKIPSNYACIDKITLYEIDYWKKQDNNCLNISHGTVISKYISNRPTDREANITGVLFSVVCFHIRMCNNPGCGPWSRVYSDQGDNTPITARKSTSNAGLSSKMTIVVITVAGLSLLLLTLVILLFILKTRNRFERQRTLEEEVGDLEPAIETELLDSSHSTTDVESLSDYATA